MKREQINGLTNTRTVIALVGCAFGLGLMVIGIGVGSSSRDRVTSAVKEESAKKLPAWNIALGDLVILAREMGFNVQGGKEAPIDEAKVAGRIEGQLQGLRDLYRQETSKNSALMGGLVLQLAVSSSGKVTKVREITSRISDNDFRTAVIADASTWSFDQVLSEESTIICPLLFVREGMDITTLIQWEKSLSQPGDRTSRAKMNLDVEPAPQITAVRNPGVRQTSSKEIAVASLPQRPLPKPQSVADGAVYQMKYTTVIREEPNYSAAAVARFTTGTKVILLGRSGDWYEVRYDGGPRGFLRKEFIAPADPAKSNS
ncbi:MAG TPA: AgmX/PglI C-terminal domain-containing protein [Candidatus Binatia bacterium]|nr:AgmX/PglI C-terminal domain-containing protein [Candidatus Binatia bacterium]